MNAGPRVCDGGAGVTTEKGSEVSVDVGTAGSEVFISGGVPSGLTMRTF